MKGRRRGHVVPGALCTVHESGAWARRHGAPWNTTDLSDFVYIWPVIERAGGTIVPILVLSTGDRPPEEDGQQHVLVLRAGQLLYMYLHHLVPM